MTYLGIDLGTASWRVAGLPAFARGRMIPRVLSEWHARPAINVGGGLRAVPIAEPIEKNVPRIKPLLGHEPRELAKRLERTRVPFHASERGPLLELPGEPLRPRDLAQRTLVDLLRQQRQQEGSISGVVVAVPPDWDAHLREAVVEGLAVAGAPDGSTVEEPLAIARLELLFDESDRTLVIVDIGDVHLRVDVVQLSGGQAQLLESAHSEQGGRAVSDALVDWLRPQLDVRKLSHAEVRQMRAAVRITKERLSSRGTSNLNLPGGRRTMLTRVQLEQLMRPQLGWLRSKLKPLKHRYRPDSLLLVGGGARIPAVRQLAEASLGVLSVQRRWEPDQGVALGAALEARVRHHNPLAEASASLGDFDLAPESIDADFPDPDGSIASVVEDWDPSMDSDADTLTDE